jgi:hypothetical protein
MQLRLALPSSTLGPKVLILKQVKGPDEDSSQLEPGLLAAMWSSLAEQQDQAGEILQTGCVTIATCPGFCRRCGSGASWRMLVAFESGPLETYKGAFC